MRSVELTAKSRVESGKGPARRLRSTGRVPAVVYGLDGASASVSVDSKELSHVIHSGGGEHIIVNLTVEETPTQMTLMQAAQHDPLSGRVEHVDFLRITADKAIHTRVEVRTVGTSEGVKLGGILELQIRELEVECLPHLIPEGFEVDVTAMEVGDTLHVSDIAIPEGIQILTPSDYPVVIVQAPSKVEEETEEGEEGEEGAEDAEATEAAEGEES